MRSTRREFVIARTEGTEGVGSWSTKLLRRIFREQSWLSTSRDVDQSFYVQMYRHACTSKQISQRSASVRTSELRAQAYCDQELWQGPSEATEADR